jgi:hypothetical protein
MNTSLVRWLGLIIVAAAWLACGQVERQQAPMAPSDTTSTPAPAATKVAPTEPGCVLDLPEKYAGQWPNDDPEALVAHLNRWDREELDVFERPDAYPGRVGSGETAGWVTEHERQLGVLGVDAVWIPAEKCYGMERR